MHPVQYAENLILLNPSLSEASLHTHPIIPPGFAQMHPYKTLPLMYAVITLAV